MRKFLSFIACLAVLLGVPWVTQAQVATSVPYSCDFESTTETSNWVLVNGTCYNHFCIDTFANTTANGHKSLYVTQFTSAPFYYGYKVGSGTAGDMTYVTSRVFAYREITFNDTGTYNIAYWWKCYGETIYDYGRVALVPSSWTLAASTVDWDSSTSVTGQYFGSHSIPSTWVCLDRGHNLSGSSTEQYYSSTFHVSAAGTYKLVVMWTNDGNTGTNPALMIDDIQITNNTCATPTHFFVNNTAQDSVSFSWEENGSATSWLVEYDTVGEFNNFTHIDTVYTTPHYTVHNLTAGGCYNFRVRALCGGTSISLPLFHQITMPTCTANISNMPYTFNLDSATSFGNTSTIPVIPCWTIINNAPSASYQGFPYLTVGNAHSGNYAFYWCRTTTANYDASPAIVLPAVNTSIYNMSNVVLKFWAKTTSTNYHPRFVVGVLGNPHDLESFTAVDTVAVEGTTMAQYTTPFTGYTGNGSYVAIRQTSPSSGTFAYCYMDDISLSNEDCPRPALTLLNVTDTSATITWPSTGAAYYEYSDTANATTGTAIYTTTRYMSGLHSNTEYTVYVRSMCSGTTGEWQPITFRTECGKTALPFSENFETSNTGVGSAPFCWRFLSDGTGSYTNYYPYVNATISSQLVNQYVYISLAPATSHASNGSPTTNMLVLPRLDTAACPIDSLRLSFYAHTNSSSSPINAIVGTLTNPDSASTFVPFDTILINNSGNYQLYEQELTGLESNAEYLAILFDRPSTVDANNYLYGYLDNVSLIKIPDCPRVRNFAVHDLSATGATISWREMGSATDWNLEIDTVEFTPTWVTPLSAYGDTNYTFNNLQPQTTYYVYIRPACDNGVAEVAEFSFTTPCNYVDSLPYTMDFEGLTTGTSLLVTDIPCWIHHNNGQTYMGFPYISSQSTFCHSGTRGLYWYKSTSSSYPLYGDEIALIAPPIDPETYDISHVTVKFWVKGTSSTYQPTFAVGVMTNPLDISTFVPCQTISMQGTTWTQLSASLINYTGTGTYIAIKSTDPVTAASSTYWYGAVDDISLEYSACPAPIPSAVATTDSVYLSWAGASSQYQIRLIATADTSTFVVNTSTTYNTYAVGGLTANTDYTFSVRGICSNDTTEWISTSFTTECNAISTLPFNYNFENIASGGTAPFPHCWSRINNSSTNNFYPYVSTMAGYAHDGTQGLRWFASPATSYSDYMYAVMPQINTDVLDISDLSLSFFSNAVSNNYRPKFYIGVMSNPDSINSFVTVDSVNIVGTAWSAVDVNFSNYTGNGSYIAVKAVRPTEAWYAATDEFSIYATPSCIRPSRFYDTNTTSSTTTINWNRGSSASNYIVEYTDGTTSQSLTTTTNSANLTGLTSNTIYQVRARAICSTGDSSTWSEYYQFRTNCAAMNTLPYTESFENEDNGSSISTSFANCWNRLNNGTSYFGYPYISASAIYAHTGTKGLYWYNSISVGLYGSYQCIVLPEVDVSVYPIDTLRLSFWAKASSTSYHPSFKVGVMTNPDSINTFVGIDTIAVEGTTMTEYQVNLNSYSGNAHYVAIKADQGNTSWTAYMDDITLDVLPTCNPPYDLRDSNVTTNSANLSWTHAGSSFIVNYRTSSATTGRDTTVNGNSLTLTGLSPITQYIWTVRSLCNTSDTSNPSEAATFTTTMCSNAAFDTIGDFTVTNFCNYLPNRESSYYSYSQQIIDSAELGLLNSFNAIDFWSTSATTQDNNCQIYIGHTGKHTFTSGSDWVPLDSLTLVWSGNMNMVAGWNTYGFDSTFAYDGHSSLVVAVYRADGASVTAAAREVCSLTDNKTLASYSYSTFTPGSIAGTVSTLRNYMRLSSCAGLPCQPPRLETAATTFNSATVSWHGNSSNYEIAMKAASAASWPDTGIALSDSSYTFSNLTPASTYLYRVRGVCDTDDISHWITGSFVTDSLPCYAPTAVTATAGFANVELNWSDNASIEPSWNVVVWNNTFRQNYTATANPFTATGLTPGVQYYAAVQSICGGGLANSVFSDTISFTTNVCDAPTNVNAAVNDNTATITWTAGNNNTGNWVVEYGYSDYASGEGTQVTSTGTSVTLSNLEAETSYDVYVRAMCDGQYPSTWSSKVTFNTGSTGIHNADNANVSIYPNPATRSTTVSVSGVEGLVNITVVDMDGRSVSNEQIECSADCVKTLNVDNLASGAYFVKIQGNGINTVKKLIVK
jgi:hypothetical protein